MNVVPAARTVNSGSTRPSRTSVAGPYPLEGMAGRPLARLRAAKRAARWARPGTRLVTAAARMRHWRSTAAAASL